MNFDIVSKLNSLVLECESQFHDDLEISIETINNEEFRESSDRLDSIKKQFEENIRTHLLASSTKVWLTRSRRFCPNLFIPMLVYASDRPFLDFDHFHIFDLNLTWTFWPNFTSTPLHWTKLHRTIRRFDKMSK